MKRQLSMLMLAACLIAPAAASEPDEGAELRALRQELRQAQNQLSELNQRIERLSRDERPLREVRSFTLADKKRPMVGIIMSATGDGRGVRLAGVTPEGPAEKAGLRSGDVVTEINGQALTGRGAVDRAYDLLGNMEAGEVFDFVYQRDGVRQTVAVTAEIHEPAFSFGYSFELPDIRFGEDSTFGLDLDDFKDYAKLYRDWQWDYQGLPGAVSLWRFGFAWSGLELARLNPGLSRYFGVTDGVLVIESDLKDSDLEGGDVIIAVNGETVEDPQQAMRLLSRFEAGERIPVTVVRDAAERQVTVVAPAVGGPKLNFSFQQDAE